MLSRTVLGSPSVFEVAGVLGPVFQSSGLASIFNPLLIENDVDSSKLFSLDNWTLVAFKLSCKISSGKNFKQ